MFPLFPNADVVCVSASGGGILSGCDPKKGGHLRIYCWLSCKFIKVGALILKYIQTRLMI